MRNVFTSSDLCHKWANQHQQSGRNQNGSMYFEGSTIYSYGAHFPIAKHVRNEQGQRAVLFTERNYSNTTAKHINHVWMSCKNDNIINCYRPDSSHDENFKYWAQNAEEFGASKLAKARKPEKYLKILSDVELVSTKYAEFFGLELPEYLKAVISIKDKSEFIAFADKKAEYIKAEEKRKAKEQKKQFKEQIHKWLNLETSRLYTTYKYDFLRINDNRIETTQAVQIPLELGKRLYQSIKNQSLKVGDKVLNYSVNEIGNEIKIGCHTFKQSYLLKFGSQLA
jgi:hypothetical protein